MDAPVRGWGEREADQDEAVETLELAVGAVERVRAAEKENRELAQRMRQLESRVEGEIASLAKQLCAAEDAVEALGAAHAAVEERARQAEARAQAAKGYLARVKEALRPWFGGERPPRPSRIRSGDAGFRRRSDLVCWHQPVAAPPNGLDVVLAARCVGKLLAQLAYEHIDDFELRLVHPAIHRVQEHLLRDVAALTHSHDLEHGVFLAGEADRFSTDLGPLHA